ncbi:hypothetical protein BH11PSE11_BH11PSE11_03850 [soil metagenome]
MPIASGLLLLIDLLCAVHIYKTGRPYWWIGIVAMIPGIGALAYLLLEVLPNAGGSRHVKRVIKHFDPGMDLRARLIEVERCGSMQNKASLADELITTGQYDDAIRLYKSAMDVNFQDDIHLQFGLATAYFWKGDAANAVEWLDRVILKEPWYKSGEAKLMRARALEGGEKIPEALEQYQAILSEYSGEEVRCRLIVLLVKQGRMDQARLLYADMEKKLRLAPPYYRRDQREFIDAAKKALKAAELAGAH